MPSSLDNIKKTAKLCQLSSEPNDDFHATTYVTARLDLHHGKSFETWLTSLCARRVQYSHLPRRDCIFSSHIMVGICVGWDSDPFV